MLHDLEVAVTDVLMFYDPEENETRIETTFTSADEQIQVTVSTTCRGQSVCPFLPGERVDLDLVLKPRR